MTLNELISAVPICILNDRLKYVRFTDVPDPFRQQFADAMIGSACPVVDGEMCAYAHDWMEWVNGRRYGGYNKPVGLESPLDRLRGSVVRFDNSTAPIFDDNEFKNENKKN